LSRELTWLHVRESWLVLTCSQMMIQLGPKRPAPSTGPVVNRVFASEH